AQGADCARVQCATRFLGHNLCHGVLRVRRRIPARGRGVRKLSMASDQSSAVLRTIRRWLSVAAVRPYLWAVPLERTVRESHSASAKLVVEPARTYPR